MNLPNYFLADLPAEASITPTLLSEACLTLRRNRERYLLTRSTHSLVHLLRELGQRWLADDYAFRKLALERVPAVTGFSRATLAYGLDRFFSQLTPQNLDALLEQDLGHTGRLDQVTAAGHEEKFRRSATATGPELLVHIAAGNLAVPVLMSLILGLLVRSAQFVKCASGASLLPRLFAHSIYDADPKIGACLELATWPGSNPQLSQLIFDEADCVTATGTDETLSAIQMRLPRKTRFIGFGHRVSFGFIAAEVLTGTHARRVAVRAAADVAAWNQLGCLSPHVFYIEEGGAMPAEQFAELLSEELEKVEEAEPRGEVTLETAAAIQSRRSIYELRAAHGPETRVWTSFESTAWTVVYEADPQFQFSCLHRFIYVKPAASLTAALQAADVVRNQTSTVGLAVPEHKAHELALELARWGASRVCPVGEMQNPPLTWRHDGRPALGELVLWTDCEF